LLPRKSRSLGPLPSSRKKPNWKRTVESLIKEHDVLEREVAVLTDECLAAKIPNRDHNLWFTLHGAVQHLLYHAGQIAMLKKAAIST